MLVSLIELRWRAQVGQAARAVGRRAQQVIAPDHLVSTIVREGRDEMAERALRRAEKQQVHQLVRTREPRIKRLWRHLFHSRTGNYSIVALHLMEEGSPYAMALPGFL